MATTAHTRCVTGTRKYKGNIKWCFTCNTPASEENRWGSTIQLKGGKK